MSTFMEAIVTVLLAVVGLAIIATVVSRNANTAGVIQASASGFGNLLAVAQSPVSGARLSPVLSYPGSDLTGGFGFGTLG